MTMVDLATRRDWTRKQGLSTDFQRTTRDDVDWNLSPLGVMTLWPAALRQCVLLAMSDSTASAVIWGSAGGEAIVYNEAFSRLIGNRHPALQGHTVLSSLSDYCVELKNTYEQVLATGCLRSVPHQRIRQDRLGFIEERTFAWKFVPIIGDDGYVSGTLVTIEDEDKIPPRRERSKSAVRELGNTLKGVIDRTAYQTATNAVRLHAHFSGSTCDCEKLWQITQQLEMHEQRYEKFADFAPVGIAAFDQEYQVEWGNKAYYDVMAQPPESKSFLSFVHPEDAAMVHSELEKGAFRDDAWTFECRLKKSASLRAAVTPLETPRPLDTSPAWVLVSAYRENDPEQHTMAWIIDITAHKHAEDILRQRMDEAVESKAQKERYIDQISHEIRNPLSAMLHCADEIIELARNDPRDSSQDTLEAAQNIAYCTTHIQHIVGDVLALSKLDSKLIEISPTPTQPYQLIIEALKIFSGQLRFEGIELQTEVDPLFKNLYTDWLLFDPRRTLQVLINLVTNAIKVVKGREKRNVIVTLSASSKYACHDNRLQCVLPRQPRQQVDFGPANTSDESVYLVISVKDTGPGLEPAELQSLFERFAQANPKTESKYGGSGLGLFISRDLTELQGGLIGVSSKPGVGSTFAFSLETKRTSYPAVPPTQPTVEIPSSLRPRLSSRLESPVTRSHTAVGGASSQAEEEVPQAPQKQKDFKASILVVEDNLINQKVLANQLRKHGYKVQCANDGLEALEILHMAAAPPAAAASTPPGPNHPMTPPPASSSQSSLNNVMIIKRKPVPVPTPSRPEKEFEIVLMDIEMPRLSGTDCTRRIRTFEAHQKIASGIPIIAVTANARSEHCTAALESGMNAVTTKPYKLDDLVSQIDRLCAL